MSVDANTLQQVHELTTNKHRYKIVDVLIYVKRFVLMKA